MYQVQDFYNNFFVQQQALLGTQFQLMANQQARFSDFNFASQSLVNNTIDSSNLYFYSLAAQQTSYLNNIGLIYAEAMQKAASKISRGGLLGLFGF